MRAGRATSAVPVGTVELLNPGLFIHTQHQRACWCIQVPAHAYNVSQLDFELGVTAELEGFDPMRLQTILFPDPAHGGGLQPTSLARRRALQCAATSGLRKVALMTACSLWAVTRRGRPARRGAQSGEPPAAKTPPPHCYHLGLNPKRRPGGRTPSPCALARITRARKAIP